LVEKQGKTVETQKGHIKKENMWLNVAKCGLFRRPEMNQWTCPEFVDGVCSKN
jgi:hypothetical protein